MKARHGELGGAARHRSCAQGPVPGAAFAAETAYIEIWISIFCAQPPRGLVGGVAMS